MLQSRHARVVAGRSKRPPRPRPKGHSAVGPTDGPPKPLRPGRVDLRRWIALGRLAHLRASPDVIPSQQGATRGRLWAYPPAWRASHPISGGVGVESPSDGIPDTRASMRTSHFGRCRGSRGKSALARRVAPPCERGRGPGVRIRFSLELRSFIRVLTRERMLQAAGLARVGLASHDDDPVVGERAMRT